MASKTKRDEPSGFRPTVVNVRPDESFRPIEVTAPAPADANVATPTAGTKKES